MLELALEFAAKKHFGQTRKVSGKPYITHPIQVCELVKKYKKSSKRLDDLCAAALLHDTLEDTNTTEKEITDTFNPFVSSLVQELTSNENLIKKLTKTEYLKIKMCSMSSYALVIKLCDRLSNVMDSPKEKSKVETKEILDFLKTNRKLSNTHKQIISEIELFV